MLPLIPLWGLRSLLQEKREEQLQYAKKLRLKYTHISNGLIRTGDIVAELYQSEVLTAKERDDIQQLLSTTVRANEQLLNTLMSKDSRACDCFLTALCKTDQNHIAEIIKREDKYLDAEHSLMIQRKYTILVDNLDVDSGFLLDRLHQANLITVREMATITAKSTKHEKSQTLLALVSSFRPENFSKFMQTLKESSQEHVVYILADKECLKTKSIISTSTAVESRFKSMYSEKEEKLQKNLELEDDSTQNLLHPKKGMKAPPFHVKRKSSMTLGSRFAHLPDELQTELSLKVAALGQKTVLRSETNVDICFRKLLQGFMHHKKELSGKQSEVEDMREILRRVNDSAENFSHQFEDKHKKEIPILGELQKQSNELQREKGELQKERDEIQKQRGKLKNQRNELQKESNELQREKDALKKQKNELQAEKDTLQNQRGKVQKQRNELQKQSNELQREKDELQKQRDELQKQSNELQREKDELQKQRDEFQSEKVQLQKQIDELQKENNILRKQSREATELMEKNSKTFEDLLMDKDSRNMVLNLEEKLTQEEIEKKQLVPVQTKEKRGFRGLIFPRGLKWTRSTAASDEHVQPERDPMSRSAAQAGGDSVAPKAERNRNRRVRGLTILKDELFVAFEKSSIIEIFPVNSDMSSHKSVEVKDLFDPGTIAACAKNSCLYAIDQIDSSRTKIVRIKPNGKVIKTWYTDDDDRGRISVNPDGNIVMTVHNKDKLKIYSAEGELLAEQTIDFSQGTPITCIFHAINSAGGNFIIAHGIYRSKLHQVCKVDAKGNVLHSFGNGEGSGDAQLNCPAYVAERKDESILVADRGNHRIILLNSELEFVKELFTEENCDVSHPGFMFLYEKTEPALLFIGCNKTPNSDGYILVLKLGQ